MNHLPKLLLTGIGVSLLVSCVEWSAAPKKVVIGTQTDSDQDVYALAITWDPNRDSERLAMKTNLRLNVPFSIEVTDQSGHSYQASGKLQRLGSRKFQMENLRVKTSRPNLGSSSFVALDLVLDTPWGIGSIPFGTSYTITLSNASLDDIKERSSIQPP